MTDDTGTNGEDRPPMMIRGPDGLVVKIPLEIRIVRGADRVARAYVDGELLALATDTGYVISSSTKGGMPGVTLTLAAERVEVVDDMNMKRGDD